MMTPIMFIGHGNPMNAIEDNEFTKNWEIIGKEIPKPKGVVCISAHWYTEELSTNDLENPRQIYDMYGFPQKLYDLKYPAKGNKELTKKILSSLGEQISIDNSWGIDHGTWSVLCKMFPNADIPVVQISINKKYDLNKHYELGKKLRRLREEGYLILGSGNIVHNLALINPVIEGYEWAYKFDKYIKENILQKNIESVINYQKEESSKKAFHTLEHFIPLLYTLGASNENDIIKVFNEKCTLGSLSMTSYMFN